MYINESRNRYPGWIFLVLSFVIFGLLGLSGLFNRGQSFVEENMLELSLAFNDLDNGLQIFLTSKDGQGFDKLKQANTAFSNTLNTLKKKDTNAILQFLPDSISHFVSGGDLSKFNFSSVNEEWGKTQKRVNFILTNKSKIQAFQSSILETQKKNKLMQEGYKTLISFLVDNHFSGNKVAVIQRQPWLADRISLRLLWLQRPLAFSPKSVSVLKAETQLFAESSLMLLKQQLGEIAQESDELNKILVELTQSISAYVKDMSDVAKIGDELLSLQMHKVIQNTNINELDTSVSTLLGSVSQKTTLGFVGSLIRNVLYGLALLLGLYGMYQLRKTLTMISQAARSVTTEFESPSSTTEVVIADESDVQVAASSDVIPQLSDEKLAEQTIDSNAEALKESLYFDAEDEDEEEAEQDFIEEVFATEASETSDKINESNVALEMVAESMDMQFITDGLEAVKRGELFARLDENHKVWGDAAKQVNTIAATMQQLVRALDVSAEQTALIGSKRSLLDANSNATLDFEQLQQALYIALERLKILDLNFKIKLNDGSVDNSVVDILSSDVGKLKQACESIDQELRDIENLQQDNYAATANDELFDNIEILSVKLKGISERFKL